RSAFREEEVAQQRERLVGTLDHRGVLGLGYPFQVRAADVPGEPARRVEEARDVVVAAYDQRRRGDLAGKRPQVGSGERLAGKRVALAWRTLQRGAHVAHGGGVVGDRLRGKPDFQEAIDQAGDAVLARTGGAHRPHAAQLFGVTGGGVDEDEAVHR